jgi:hypothetical protein
MEPINQKRKLYRKIKTLMEETTEEKSEFPCSFTYCEGTGKPMYTFNIDRKQLDHFIDENGQKWIKA